MKQFLIILLLLCSIGVFSQDVIVKKNGSTIVCRVIEVTSLDITYRKWNDLNGSNYVMNRADASVINYESGNKKILLEPDEEEGSSTENRSKTYIPKCGLKIFIEDGYTYGMGSYDDRISFITTVGFQFNPYIFIGVGSMENYFVSSKLYGIPIFADMRLNLIKTSVSPLLDVKVGHSIADVKGFFFAPSVGCRFGFYTNSAVVVCIGYELQRTNSFNTIAYSLNKNKVLQSRETVKGFTVKVGFDF